MKEFTTKTIAISKNEFGIIDSLSELIAYDSKKLTLIKKQVNKVKSRRKTRSIKENKRFKRESRCRYRSNRKNGV